MGEPTPAAYSGTENLEVMSEATFYNGFLTDLIAKISSEGDRVLDFGAGLGTFALRTSKAGLSVACLEPDLGQADILREHGFDVITRVADVAAGN